MRIVVATPELIVSIGKGGDLFPIPADRVFLKTLRGNRRIRKKSALAFNGEPQAQTNPWHGRLRLAVKR